MKWEEFNYKLGAYYSANRDRLVIITCYEKPLDYPENFVARVSGTKGNDIQNTDIILLADSVEELHKNMPNQHFVWLNRQEQDEQHILGTYI